MTEQPPYDGVPVDPNAPQHPSAYRYPPGYPPAGYPAPYPMPGYAAPGYPTPGYPTPNYPAPGYPAPGYPVGYAPQYPPDPRHVRPGVAMGSAVLAFVDAGLLIIAGGLLLLGASIVADLGDSLDTHTGYGTEIALDGIATIVAAGLLIAGGVMLTSRNRNGRALLTAGNAIVVALTLYWLIRFTAFAAAGLIFYSLLFAALAIVSLVLSWVTPVNAWLAASLPSEPQSR